MENQKKYDLLDLLVYLWKKKLPIIIITIAGAVISIVVSLLLQDQFKASTVLFPTSFVSPTTSTIRHINQETDPLIIGDEDDLERMIQLLKSDYITDRIIKKYDLIKHYDIAEDDPYVITKVKKNYYGNVSFSKTSYQGVIVSVIDTDPQTSADIANDISVLLDSLISDMQKQRTLEAYLVVKEAYKNEKAFLNELEDSLDIYRQLGVLDYVNEVERYSEAYGKAIGNNTITRKAEQFFSEKFELLKKYGKASLSLNELIDIQQDRVISVHHNMLIMQQNINKPMTHKYVISYAQKPDKKSSPKRSFIVIFSTLGAFFFSIALILFLDFILEFKKRIKKTN